MSDVVFRSSKPATTIEARPVPGQPKEEFVKPGEVDVEPPFTDYERETGNPFAVDYYDLGNMWNRGDMYSDAFIPEVNTVSQYMEHIISRGDIGNTTEAVKNELKRIEKVINVRKDQRKSVRIGLVAEYMKFILKSENIKMESAKHGMI